MELMPHIVVEQAVLSDLRRPRCNVMATHIDASQSRSDNRPRFGPIVPNA